MVVPTAINAVQWPQMRNLPVLWTCLLLSFPPTDLCSKRRIGRHDVSLRPSSWQTVPRLCDGLAAGVHCQRQWHARPTATGAMPTPTWACHRVMWAATWRFCGRRRNALTRTFRRRHFPDATNRDWNDWRWQSRHRVRTLAQLEKMLRLSDDEREALVQGGTMLPVGISPYYMSLLDADDPRQPLRRTVVPTINEFVRTEGEADDPLGEDSHSPVPGLVHRYPDRVLLLPLDFCSTYCRYCTRFARRRPR